MVALSFGFLVLPFQALDVIGPMDVVDSSSISYVRGLEQFGAASPGLADSAIDVSFQYIGEAFEPVGLSGNVSVVPSVLCDTTVQVDYLLIGGPPPDYRISPCFADLVKRHVASGKPLFTTCTGSLVAAQTGVLDGDFATATHAFLPFARDTYPNVEWRENKSWEISKRGVWSSDGAVAGMDMLWYWVRKNYGDEIANVSVGILNYTPRDVHGNPIYLS